MRANVNFEDVTYMHGRTHSMFGTMFSFSTMLWLCYLTALLESFAFYSFTFVFVMYLSEDHHFDDVNAGRTYAMFGVMSIFFSAANEVIMMEVGYLYKTSVFGLVIVSIARLLLPLAKNLGQLASVMFFLLPMGSSFNVTQMEAAIVKLTTPKTRSFAISMFEVTDNLGGLIAAMSVDILRYMRRDGMKISIMGTNGYFDQTISKYEIILLAAAFASFIILLIQVIFVGDLKLERKKAVDKEEEFLETPSQHIRRVLRDPRFWIVMAVTLFLTGTRTIYRHLEVTMPKYMTRYFGSQSPWGTLLGMTKISVVLFGPAVRHYTARIGSYSCLLLGTSLVTGCTLVLPFLQNYYSMFLFVVILGIAEEIWGPRLMEIIAAVSGDRPKSKLYNRISIIVSSLVAAFVAGYESGPLLEAYCPEFGTQHTGTLWLIIAATALFPPLGLYILRPGIVFFVNSHGGNWSGFDDYEVVRRTNDLGAAESSISSRGFSDDDDDFNDGDDAAPSTKRSKRSRASRQPRHRGESSPLLSASTLDRSSARSRRRQKQKGSARKRNPKLLDDSPEIRSARFAT